MAEISQSTKSLIQKYQSWYQSTKVDPNIATIHVDEVASALAGFYEKIREVVEWREEQLMRRAAIERMIKRRLLVEKDGKEISYALVMELIRGGHFPNDKMPESKINDVQRSIEKYLYILGNEPEPPKGKQKVRVFDWILAIAACELEEILAPPSRERALIEYMTESMEGKIEIRKGSIAIREMPEEEKNLQIYIAVQKALFKMDPAIISYSLLKRKFPQWCDIGKNDLILGDISRDIYLIHDEIERTLNHPMSKKFYKVCERYDTPYMILGDVMSENPMEAVDKIGNPEVLESRITEAYNRRLKASKSKVRRAAFFATISIFITKTLLAFAIEIPFDKYITGQFDYMVLGLNIVIPPLLMFFLILTIRPPAKENLQQVIMETIKISYERKERDVYLIKPTRKRGWLMQGFLTVFYFLTFVLSFGLIIRGLREINFGAISIIIFLIFVSLISFAGVKIRERSKELEVAERKESFLVFFIDLFSLPIIRMGRWLSRQWTRYNIIVVFINFFIDMPFQKFVEFLEQWRTFLKEKKEEIH